MKIYNIYYRNRGRKLCISIDCFNQFLISTKTFKLLGLISELDSYDDKIYPCGLPQVREIVNTAL